MAYKSSYDSILLSKSPRKSRPYTTSFEGGLSRRRTASPPNRFVSIREDRGLYRDSALSMTDTNLKYDSHREKAFPRYGDSPGEGSLRSQIYELETKIRQKETQLAELERELQNYQEIENQQTKTIRQLHDRVENLQKESSDYTGVHSKFELTIATLQSENRQLEERIGELEGRLRRQLEDKDMSNHAVNELRLNYDELRRIISTSIFTDGFLDNRTHESLVRKLKEHLNEFHEAKSHIMKLEDNLRMSEEESKRNQETVRKLLEDVDKTRKYISGTDMIREERDGAMRKHDLLQEELKKMEDRLGSHQHAWETAQHELRQYQVKLGETDSNLRKQEFTYQAQAQEFRAFKETIAALLSDTYITMPASEEAIKEKVRQLMQNKQDVSKVSKHLEEKIKELSAQLEEQADLHKTAVQRARKAEEESGRLRDNLRSAEGELVATDILKDGLKSHKNKYERFWDQMVEIMKMRTIVQDLGVELNSDALLARAEQLVRLEEESYGKRNTQLTGMQQQLLETRRQLETKDMHLDLLRKKLVALESDISEKVEHDWDDVIDKNKKLNRHTDKLVRSLHESKQTIQSLKSEAVENKALKITIDEQKRTIRELEKRFNEVEHQKSKHVRKFNELRSEKEAAEAGASHGFRVTESTIQSISNELQRTKQRLDEVMKKEKQLADLRHVIARMLGLDVRTIAVPDYEIISRLEKLIESQHEIALDYGSKKPSRSGLDDATSRRFQLESQRRQKSRQSHTPSRWK